MVNPRAGMPPTQRPTRAVRTPVRRLTPYAQTGATVDLPANNATGKPSTPSSGTIPTAPDAHGDTETMEWNEAWDDSGKPKKTPEDTDDAGRIQTETEDGKPQLQPGLDDSTKATQINKGSGTTIDHFGDTAPVPLDNQGDKGDDAPTAIGGVADTVDLAADKADISRIDDPPSPADVPLDMKFDPGGEAIPGLMPPDPAPVPGVDDTEPDVKKGVSSDALITPLGSGGDNDSD